MKNHTLSRVTAVLLCVAMMLMVMPVMQIAAATEITSIGVSQAAPFGGYRASDLESRYSFDFGGISPTYSNSTYFLKTTDPEPTEESEWVSLEPDECFEPGVTYAKYFRSHLDDTSTYVFADETTLNIQSFEGVKATIGSLNPQDVEFGFIYTDVKGFPADSYRLAVGDTIVTEANAGDILGNGTATYDAATATLTLKNATINKAFADDPSTYAGITALDDLTINLEGTNTIDLSSLDMRESVYGISAFEDLTLAGDGDLTVTVADAEYYSCAVDVSGILTMMHGGNWKFTAGAIETYGDASAAIYANNRLVIEPTKVGAALSLSARTYAIIAYSFEAVDYSVKANTVYGDALVDVEFGTFRSNPSAYREVKLTAEENTVYDLMVGGVDVTDANKGNILGDGTAKYDPATRTLTLNKANLTKAFLYNSTEAAVIYTGKPLTINLVGDNVLDTTGADAYPTGCSWSGIITSESFRLTLTGDGNLTLKAGDLAGQNVNGIFSFGSIDVDMTGSLSVSNTGAKKFFGIWSEDSSVSLKVGGKLTLDGGSSDTSDSTPLVFAEQNIYLTTPAGATATIKNGNRSNKDSVALYTDDGDISIVNDGTLSITTGDAYYDSIPVFADETLSIVNNGTMTVTAGDAGDDAYAILADNGDLYIVNNGTMTVTTGDATDDSDAIEGYEAMRLSGDGTMTVMTGDGDYTSAIYGPDLLVISGKGTYSFSSGIADNWSAAVYAYGLRIEDDV
ncbi:MAG: hypothetical protein IKI63_00220, partial [Clostridia bacterium]|nr:hypothetical protein [Clostridia bacterium]